MRYPVAVLIAIPLCFALVSCGGSATTQSTSTSQTSPSTYDFIDGITEDNAYVYYDYSTTPPTGGIAGPSEPASPFWHINQYESPEPVSPMSGPSTACSPAALWSLGNDATNVCWIQDPSVTGSYDIEFSQDGQAASPNQLGCGTEWDLQFGQDNYNPVPVFQNSPTLAAMGHLTVGLTLQLLSNSVAARCGASNPWLDQSEVGVGITLGNKSAGETLFYQLVFSASNDSFSQSCNQSVGWFWAPESGSPNVYGVDDFIGTSYGQTCAMVNGPAMTYSLDILPQLKVLINSVPGGGLDQNLADWTVNGVYYSGKVLGGASVKAKFSNISLSAVLAS